MTVYEDMGCLACSKQSCLRCIDIKCSISFSFVFACQMAFGDNIAITVTDSVYSSCILNIVDFKCELCYSAHKSVINKRLNNH